MKKRCRISTIAAAGLSVAFALGMAFGAGAQPDEGEWLEVVTTFADDTWSVDSPEGFEIIGTESSWGDNPANYIQAAFDQDFGTFFDAPTGDPAWMGLDLGPGLGKRITGIRYAPREGFAGRGVGATIQGANQADLGDAEVLLTLEEEQTPGQWNTFNIDHDGYFRYVFYEGPPDDHTDIAAIEFYGADPPPLVVSWPDSMVTVGEGGAATLGPVEVHEEWADEAEISWYYARGTAAEQFLGTGNTWQITDTSAGDEGIYTAVVSHPMFEDDEEFEVELVVSIVTSPPEDQEALLGEDALFSVTAIEGATFEWYFEGESISEQRILVIENIGVEDYGTYTVWVRHDDFTDEEWQAELTAPDLVETPPDPVVGISEGEDGTLGPVLVYSEYEADASYSWIFEGTEVGTEASYTITEASREDEGVYTLTVSHPSFPFDEVYEVEVLIPPFAPAAGGLGLGLLAGAFALLGGAYGVRRMRK